MYKPSSVLSKLRQSYQPKVPPALRHGARDLAFRAGPATESAFDQDRVRALFPNTYGAPIQTLERSPGANNRALCMGVILSGGQAPGGHNVIAGIFDALKSIHPESRLLGFLGGPSGLENGKYIALDAATIDDYRNTGGFDMIGAGRTKIETPAQFEKCAKVVKELRVDALVVIGGDDSNTNAATLAEYFLAQGIACSVIGCPKTIDGDLKNEWIESSFGFDTAAKTYADLIGNIARDANSAKKYWHFIKLMGRAASHIGLECALQCHPNIALISEEVLAKKMTLRQVVDGIANVVEARGKAGKPFGVALVPEGLIEFIPEFKVLISELNDALSAHEAELAAIEDVAEKCRILSEKSWISQASAGVLSALPPAIAAQLLLDRDPHGNVQVSQIDTEKLLIEMVKRELKSRGGAVKLNANSHFFGYEGRCAAPSNFDADYCYSLGYVAALLGRDGLTGTMACIRNLHQDVEQWVAAGIPICTMMNIERRHGEDKPVIRKALVDLEAAPFQHFAQEREHWALHEDYVYPGSIQYFGPSELADRKTETLRLEHQTS
jgi:pyrophosphate--fructose-6-phosphate 1-phosphotransferase